MKLLIFTILLAFTFSLGAAVLVLEGKYQNKNLYVHNSFIQSGVGFCVKEIKVNGQITTDETNSSAFEIDLKSLQLKYGDDVMIEIIHSDGCTPKVLNIEDLKPLPTFEVLMMNCTNEGLLKWVTRNETGILPYVIEQYKWNKWVPVGMVTGLGTGDPHEYIFRVPMHSGKNKYRVKQKGLNATVKTSQEISSASLVNKPSFAIPKDLSSIDFSADTYYELYDAYGQIVRKGYGIQINLEKLPKGDYYICYDNEVAEFRK
jgi:hypothetical protein